MGIAIIIHVDDLLAQVAECHGGRLSLENKLDLIQRCHYAGRAETHQILEIVERFVVNLPNEQLYTEPFRHACFTLLKGRSVTSEEAGRKGGERDGLEKEENRGTRWEREKDRDR